MRIREKLNEVVQMLIKIFKEGFLYILSGNILVKAVNMLASIILVRLIDKNDYAHYSYAVNLYSYIDLIAGLGLASALLKFSSGNISAEKDKAYFVFAGKWGLLIQILISILLCMVVLVVPLPFEEAKKYIYALVLLPSLSYFLSVLQIYLRAHEHYVQYAKTGLIQAFIIFILGSFLAWIFDVLGLVIARYVAVFAVIYYAFKVIFPQVRGIPKHFLEKREIKEFFGVGISLMMADFFSAVMPINEAFLVNNLIKDEIVTANFKVAGILPSQLVLLTGSVVIFFFPKVAKYEGKNVLKSIFKIAGFNLLFVTVVTVIGVLFTPMIINILYGDKYQDAFTMSYLLWIMRYINVAFRMIPMNFLPALGEAKFNAICCAVSCFLHIIIDYYCIDNYGINGLAIATIIVYLLSGVAFWTRLVYVCKWKSKERLYENID